MKMEKKCEHKARKFKTMTEFWMEKAAFSIFFYGCREIETLIWFQRNSPRVLHLPLPFPVSSITTI